jgi:hypothetical protein
MFRQQSLSARRNPSFGNRAYSMPELPPEPPILEDNFLNEHESSKKAGYGAREIQWQIQHGGLARLTRPTL